ncbi:MAG: LacI family DNA-binding transcriptional regulator [Kiritimatiellae bacterium]|nr:LacI family DNA-binding transcriptional regulator [Kiritimatiellia bacterium]
MKRATQKHVAREAGVSEATVSRVLNNSPLVHDATRRRVMDAMQRLGYAPSAAARNLSRDRTDAMGVVFHQMSSGFFASVMAGIDAAAREKGYHILTALSRDTKEERDICYGMLDETRVDGLIVLDAGLSDETIARLKDYRQPFVLIQREPNDPTVSTIAVDNQRGARDAMKHLLNLGYKDLLVIKGPPGAQDSQLRIEGCKQAIKEAGRGVTCRYIDGFYNADRAAEAFRAHHKEHGLPRAVFALNDAMAIAVLKELRGLGARVPDDVAVVGFDGIESADHLGLTTVETPMESLGAGAVRLLLEHLNEPERKADHVRLETRLVVRATCGGVPR